MRDLIIKTSEEIMTTLYKPTVFAVDGLLAQGLFILAGSPKVGKSWLALELCLAVAKGEKLFERETSQGSVLYFCLEDSYTRIQSRLYELTDEPTDKLFFSLKADTIGNGLEEQTVKFKSEHNDLRLIVIDTLQMVRNETESSYGSDYAEIVPLKSLAEQLGITIVLVHHLRKAADSDPFNMISGSTGLSGATDGQLVLKKDSRCGGQAVLYATGRDIEDQELSLTKCGARWVLADEHEDKPPDLFPFAVHDLMAELVSFKGSATELCGLLKERYGGEYFANRLTRDLFRKAYELRDLGVTFEPKRRNGQRLLLLRYDKNSDSSDGKNLMPEQPQTADPAVTAESVDCSGISENTLSEVEVCSSDSENYTDPVPESAVPAEGVTDPEYVLIEGMAEYYSKNLAREVMKGLNENALKCKSNGGRPPFGFKVNKETQTYEIVEEEARAVRFMFESISQGKSYDYIIKELDRQGFRTRDGNPFGKNLIHEMLKNEKYRGVYIYNRRASKDAMGRYNSRASKFDDEIVRIEGGMPRIVDDELWNNVNKLIISRRRLKDYGGRKIRAYLLTGKILCGNCGSTRYAGKNHARYSSYSCSKKSNHSGLDCKTKEIRMEYIEDYVLREILRVVLADDRIPALVRSYQDAYAQRKSGATDELKAIRAAIKVCEQKIANIIQVISTTGSPTLVNALEGLESEKAKLESELIAAESNMRTSVLTEDEIKAAYIKARELFLQGDYETKRQLINLYLDKVLVYDDYVEVYINALPDYIRQKLIKKIPQRGRLCPYCGDFWSR